MPAIADIKTSTILTATPVVITTSATVGVDTTFSPDVITPEGVARWVSRASGIIVGYPEVTMSVRAPVRGSNNYKVTMVVSIPTLETLGTSTASGILPANLVGYRCVARLEFTLPVRSTLAERTILFNHVLSLMLTTITASDAAPSDATGSPLSAAVTTLANVY